ncbi:hypothetical protein [Knoellia subterranea]|uniref:hypothetical protein n=1 Tax=Knoellia subterranea TaxID=184882 RepID=UPI001B808B33|nr:hypothetical protein [Knoellia subterranea]
MVERGRVVPALGERLENVGHGRSADLGHRVVPGRGRTVALVERRCLRIAVVVGVVASAVAEVDAAHEGDVVLWPALEADDDELLVVRPGAAHPLVEKGFAAGLVDDLTELVVLLAVEPAGVRAPQKGADLDAAVGR